MGPCQAQILGDDGKLRRSSTGSSDRWCEERRSQPTHRAEEEKTRLNNVSEAEKIMHRCQVRPTHDEPEPCLVAVPKAQRFCPVHVNERRVLLAKTREAEQAMKNACPGMLMALTRHTWGAILGTEAIATLESYAARVDTVIQLEETNQRRFGWSEDEERASHMANLKGLRAQVAKALDGVVAEEKASI